MNLHDPNHVVIFDTTLRDGEQSPGATLNHSEKLIIAEQLCDLGVDVIEAGFPIASPGDFAAVKKIAETIAGPTICGLARIVEKDIVCAGEALAPAKRRRIHTFSSASDIHLEHILRISRQQNIEKSVKAVKLALTFTDDVEYSAQDTTRADRDYLVDLYTAIAEAGATTLNIPDTVGYTTPREYYDLIAFLRERIKIPNLIFSVHCHNDLGLSVANALSAVQAGARQVECSLNGIGERAGNCSLEEVVMSIKTRADVFGGAYTNINTRRIYPACKLAARLMNAPIPRGKPIVGANAFAHESGIHQDGILKERTTYEIMHAADVGIETGTDLVLGKHSGRHAFGDRMRKLGFHFSDAEREAAYNRFIALADKKKFIYDDDLLVIAHGSEDIPGVYRIEALKIVSEYVENFDCCRMQSNAIECNRDVKEGAAAPSATITLSHNGATFTETAEGDGPVDAAISAIDKITLVPAKLLEYSLQAVSAGGDAQGEVSVRVEFPDGDRISGKAASTDIVVASAKAYLACVNRKLSQTRK